MKYVYNVLNDYEKNKMNKILLIKTINTSFIYATKTSFKIRSEEAFYKMLEFDEKIKKLEFKIKKFEIVFNSLDLDNQEMIEYIYNSNYTEFAKIKNISVRTVFRRMKKIDKEWRELWGN